MTRVEKYAAYREEIQNSFNDVSTKEKSSDRVKKIVRKGDTSNTISYDDVMGAYEIYDSNTEQPKRKMLNLEKRQIIFVTSCLLVIIALAIALVFVGLKAFGGI